MEKNEIIKGLEDIVEQERVLTDEQSVLEGAKDYIGFRVFQRADGKNFAPRAACVVKAKSTEEVSNILKFLNDNKVDVVPRTG
ncbi:MAG: FAD-binding oxidoreductase, partial [Oscillospiraceae bacterium]